MYMCICAQNVHTEIDCKFHILQFKIKLHAHFQLTYINYINCMCTWAGFTLLSTSSSSSAFTSAVCIYYTFFPFCSYCDFPHSIVNVSALAHREKNCSLRLLSNIKFSKIFEHLFKRFVHFCIYVILHSLWLYTCTYVHRTCKQTRSQRMKMEQCMNAYGGNKNRFYACACIKISYSGWGKKM